MNKVILLGNVTRDIELTGSSTTLTKFSLAVTRQFKKDETDFINCIAFGKTAETLSQYVKKGQKIAITGNIRTGSYENRENQKVFTTDVIIESFEFVGGAKQNNNQEKFDATPCDEGDMPF